jgi:hypothetical protein
MTETTAATTIDAMSDPLIERLSRDVREAATLLSANEARYLVEMYYDLQGYRIDTQQRIRKLVEADAPLRTLNFVFRQVERVEHVCAQALDAYSEAKPLGRWARSIHGIGPKIAAGMLAHIDLSRTQTAGQLWAFAGLDPTKEWKKGEKRPWNARLKRLCWIIGESFVKVSGNEDAFYGRIYRERKELETAKNAAGDYADQAAQVLDRKRFRADTDARKAYEAGILPKAHIHARAKRYAVKLFLAHYFEIGCKLDGRTAPAPYAVAHLGHAHYIAPPGIDNIGAAA